MNRKNLLWILFNAIFIIVFNVVFFVIGGEHNPSVWISYGFIHLSYALVILGGIFSRNDRHPILRLSMSALTSYCFLAEFIVGLVFILLNLKSYKPALVVQIILLGISLALFILNFLANEKTSENLDREKKENDFIKTCALRVKALIGKIDERGCDRALEKLYDVIHSSPSKTSNEATGVEEQAQALLSDLESAVAAKEKENTVDLAKDIRELFEQRNRLLRKF